MDNTNIESVKITIPGHNDFLPVATNFIKDSAIAFGAIEMEADKIQLAAEETISNIIKHSLKNNRNESLSIICSNTTIAYEVVIQDKGLPFSPDDLPEYDPNSIDNDLDINGLGMFLIKNSIDEIIFRNLGRDGHETVLIKYKASKHISNQFEKVVASEKEAIKDAGDWKIRGFEPDDALEISRCAYNTYGYTYEPYIYFPEKITEMNQTGSLISLVAYSESEELMGHMALKFYAPGDPIAEIGVAFVNPAFRRNGIFAQMTDVELAEGKNMGLSGIYARAVTSHYYSQKMLVKNQFTSCGIMLGLFPSDVEFKKLVGKIKQKESALLAFLKFSTEQSIQIFAPVKHRNMIQKIYAQMGVSVTLGNDNKIHELSGKKMEYNKIDVFNAADIYAYQSDDEVYKEIKSALKRLCLEHTDSIYLFLDLENSATPELAEKCEEIGFFFSGILPFGIKEKHAMIYQYLNNLEIDFEKMELYDEFGKEITDYVQKCYDNR